MPVPTSTSLTSSVVASARGGSSSPRRGQTLLVTLALALPAAILAWWPQATALAVYDRGRIAAGELWRLVTGHWTHWNPDHLGWDLLAFTILTPLCLSVGRRKTAWTLLAASLLIPLAIWIAIPGMTEYRGLSGLDSALFTLLATSLLRREIRAGSWCSAAIFGGALVAFVVKLVFELATGTAVFVESSGFVPVPLAHAVGGACGALAAFGRLQLFTRK